MVLQVDTAEQYDPIFIVPIFPNIHISPCTNLQNVYFRPRNKTDKPATKLAADIFSPERFALQGFGLSELHPSLVRSRCQYPAAWSNRGDSKYRTR